MKEEVMLCKVNGQGQLNLGEVYADTTFEIKIVDKDTVILKKLD